MAGWIKMPLGTEVGLDPGNIVLDGDLAPPPKAAQPPLFDGNWTTRGYANLRTAQLSDGLDNSCTSQLADWTSRGLETRDLADAAKRTTRTHREMR